MIRLLILLLVVGSLAQPTGEITEYTKCEEVKEASREQRCFFVKTLCPLESRKGTLSIDYLSLYYCHVESGSLVRKIGFWAMLIALAAILFSLLGDTAEKYFSPALTQICQQVPKMRPRFAGVTVLAFANGAPDLSATINAIKTCKFGLSLGALTGAGMFVNCFVAGWIIILSGGARCRGATIRDVSTYFITIFGVLIALLVHRIGVAAVVLAFVLYFGFVVVVFGADEWHEKGRPDFWSKPIDHLSTTFGIGGSETDDALLMNPVEPVWASYEDLDVNEPIDEASGAVAQRFESREGYPVIWAQLSPDQYRQQALAEMAGSDDDLYDYPLDSALMDDPQDQPMEPDRPQAGLAALHRLGSSVLPFETDQADQAGAESGVFGSYPWLRPIWETLLMDDLPDQDSKIWHLALLAIRLPFLLLQRATIPLTSQEHFSRTWLVVSVALSPLMIIVYFNYESWLSIVLAILIGMSMGAITYTGSKGTSKPPSWSFGTSWPIGGSAVALYGLVIGIFWIDILAGELVDLLYCAGTVTGIPEAVLGLTVLAWGNSIGDFFTNSSIARAGKGNMALTACYAGPVFNMLMGLGLGFISFFATHHRSSASIHAGPQVILGCVCLLLHAAGVIFIGIRKGFRLPPKFGYFSIGVYAFYLVMAVSLQFLVGNENNNDTLQCSDPM